MRRKQQANIKPDEQLEVAVQKAINLGIPLSKICKRADVNQATLWKWRTQKTSPVMSVRQEVLDAIEALIREEKAAKEAQ